jgi:hypothetical protein
VTRRPPLDATKVLGPVPSTRRLLGRQPRRALWLFAALEVLNLFSVAGQLVIHPAWRVGLLIYIGVFLVASAAVGVFFRFRIRDQTWLFAAPDRIGYQGLRNKPRVVARSDLTRIRRVSALSFGRLRTAQIRGRHLLFLGAAGVCLLRVAADTFADGDLEAFLKDVDVPVEGRWSDLETVKQLRQRFPNSFPWAVAHVFAVTLVGVLVAGAVGVALGLALGRHA